MVSAIKILAVLGNSKYNIILKGQIKKKETKTYS